MLSLEDQDSQPRQFLNLVNRPRNNRNSSRRDSTAERERGVTRVALAWVMADGSSRSDSGHLVNVPHSHTEGGSATRGNSAGAISASPRRTTSIPTSEIVRSWLSAMA